jgi:cytochrome c-type biogenesis protein CcmH/NrfG
MPSRLNTNKPHDALLLAILALVSCFTTRAQTADPLAPAMESARRKRDPVQLESLKSQLERRIHQDPNDSQALYQLALVEGYLVDVAERRKDKKAATASLDEAIQAAQLSIQRNGNSADVHSLLADFYGRKISLGNGMFAGPRFGPKVDEENKRAMALDDKNPRVWASRGRQYLMAPKAFGGDTLKAIDSFRKSLALDPDQDETWVWLAKAYLKQNDKASARDALHHGLQLNPQDPWAQETSKALEN